MQNLLVVNINKIVEKCQKVINIMRCVSGVEWGSGGISQNQRAVIVNFAPGRPVSCRV